MSKDRRAVTCNGRASFYACMWDDIRQCAMDQGWAVALHGSLNSDMDIMAMPWVNEHSSFQDLVDSISRLFRGNQLAENYMVSYLVDNPDRIVATIPIFGDFYLDISTIESSSRESRSCAFCRVFDFATARVSVNVDRTDARIMLAGGNTKFPEYQQFEYCPVCGRYLKGGLS